MDQIINDPTICHFLQSIREKDRKQTLKQLLLLGIHAVSSKVHEAAYCCCRCACKCRCSNGLSTAQHNGLAQGTAYVPYQFGNSSTNNIANDIQQMKNRINYQAGNVHKNHNKDNIAVDNLPKQKPYRQHPAQQHHPVTDQAHNLKFRHHLDDSQVRKALVNPYAKQSPPKKDKKQELERLYRVQKQIDAEDIKALKERTQINTRLYDQQQNNPINTKKTVSAADRQSYQFKNVQRQNSNSKASALNTVNEAGGQKSQITNGSSKKKTTKNNSMIEARSKIKSLVEKDKQRSKKSAFQKKSQHKMSKRQMYEYSDQDINEESSSLAEDSICPIHPNQNQESYQQNQSRGLQNEFKHTYKQTKKRLRESKRQMEMDMEMENSQSKNIKSSNKYQNAENDDSDQISESSSFSKFSMSSKRQNGKISSAARR